MARFIQKDCTVPHETHHLENLNNRITNYVPCIFDVCSNLFSFFSNSSRLAALYGQMAFGRDILRTKPGAASLSRRCCCRQSGRQKTLYWIIRAEEKTKPLLDGTKSLTSTGRHWPSLDANCFAIAKGISIAHCLLIWRERRSRPVLIFFHPSSPISE